MTTQGSLVPIFIGGTGRSGTTAVFRGISGGRGVVSAAPELRVHIDPGGALDLLDALSDNWSPYQADIAIDRFRRLMRSCRKSNRFMVGAARAATSILPLSPWRYPGMSLGTHFGLQHFDNELERLVSRLAQGRSAGYWAGSRPLGWRPTIYETAPMPRSQLALLIGDFFGRLYGAIAGPDDSYWCESSPYSILHATKLLEIFPDARFIHVIRCPLDTAASYLKKSWGGDDISMVSHRLANVYDRIRTVRETLPDSRLLEIRIEDLAEHPRTAWRRVEEFLQCGSDFDFDTRSVHTSHLNRNRWKSELSPQAIDTALELLQPAMEAYGYSRT